MHIVRNPIGQYILYGARRDKGTRAILAFYGWRYLRPFDGMLAAWGTSDGQIATTTADAFGLTIEHRDTWDAIPAA